MKTDAPATPLLEKQVVSRPGAVLEVVVIRMPQQIQEAIARNLERARQAATQMQTRQTVTSD